MLFRAWHDQKPVGLLPGGLPPGELLTGEFLTDEFSVGGPGIGELLTG
jgi:hypothetical protein